jgi:hypothetical protein
MKAQSEIGEFADEREAGRVVLTAQDQAHYKDWNFVSEKCFQDEIVEFLLYEEIKVKHGYNVLSLPSSSFRSDHRMLFCNVNNRALFVPQPSLRAAPFLRAKVREVAVGQFYRC